MSDEKLFEEDLEFDDLDLDDIDDVQDEPTSEPGKEDLTALAEKQGALIAENILMKKMMENPQLAQAIQDDLGLSNASPAQTQQAFNQASEGMSEDDKIAYLEKKIQELEQKQKLSEDERRWQVLESEAQRRIEDSPIFQGFSPEMKEKLREEFLLNYAASGSSMSIDAAFKKWQKDFNTIRKEILKSYINQKLEKKRMPISPQKAFSALKEETPMDEIKGDDLASGKAKELAKRYLQKLRGG